MLRTRVSALLIMFAVVVAACGGSDDGSVVGQGADGATEEEVSSEDLDLDATFVYGAGNLPTRFDPHRSSGGGDQNWTAPVYDRLIDQNTDAELIPGLATEWEFTDELTFDMTLREDVVFHDGTPFNAEAVRANIDRAINVEGSGVFAYLASIDTVEVVDDTHVRFHLNRPDSTLPNQLATRPGMIASPAAFDSLDTNPVGTGKFRLLEYREGDRAIYERNEDYWGELPNIERLEIVYMLDPTTRANALISGEVDAAPIEPADVAQVEGAGFEVSVHDGIQLWHFFLNRNASEFGDVRVRQAIEHAVDRQALVDVLLLGYGTPSNQWVAEGTPYFNEDYAYPYYEYDPARSRELLAEAGLPDGFTFEILVPNSAFTIRLAEVLQQQLAEAGITMELRQVAASESTDIFFVRKEGVALLINSPGRIDPAELVQIYFNPESFSNPGGHSTPEVMETYEQALAAFEDPEKTETRIELSGLITEQALGPVLFYPQPIIAHSDDVVNLEWYLSGHIEFETVGKRAG